VLVAQLFDALLKSAAPVLVVPYRYSSLYRVQVPVRYGVEDSDIRIWISIPNIDPDLGANLNPIQILTLVSDTAFQDRFDKPGDPPGLGSGRGSAGCDASSRKLALRHQPVGNGLGVCKKRNNYHELIDNIKAVTNVIYGTGTLKFSISDTGNRFPCFYKKNITTLLDRQV
jgi:hypothetical protein